MFYSFYLYLLFKYTFWNLIFGSYNFFLRLHRQIVASAEKQGAQDYMLEASLNK